MKIAIFDMDNLRNPFWAAGQARATREVGKILAKKHQITVYSSKYPGYKDYHEDGISYKHIGIISNSPKLTNIFYILSVPSTVSKVHADIIVENFNAPISTSFAPIFSKKPVVGLPTMFAAEEFRNKYHLPFDWIEKIGCRFYKYFLPYSKFDNDKIKKINPKVITKIVPQGVGQEYFKIKLQEPKFILFLGRFDIEQKGTDLLLNAYARIAEKIKWPLVIAGHGPDENKIKKQIKKLHLENRVKIVGPAYGQKKIKLLSQALFVTIPSRHDETPVFALEALASGLPIVCFDIDGLKWLTKKVSLKAKPFDTEDYSKILGKAANSKEIRILRKNTRNFIKKYSWENVAREYETYFKFIISRENNNKNHE